MWWKDLDYRRAWTGRYSAGGFVFFNRLTLEGYVNRLEQQSYINAELETPITHQLDSTQLSIELRLLRRLSFVVSGSRSELRIDPEGLDPQLGHWYEALERDEDVLRVGLRYTFSENLAITIGGQRSEADFTQPITTAPTSETPLHHGELHRQAIRPVGQRRALHRRGRSAARSLRPSRAPRRAGVARLQAQRLGEMAALRRPLARVLDHRQCGTTDTRVGTGCSAWSAGHRHARAEGKFSTRAAELSSFDRDYTGWGAGILDAGRGASLGVSWTETSTEDVRARPASTGFRPH